MQAKRAAILLVLSAVMVAMTSILFDQSITVRAQGCVPGVPCPPSTPVKKPKKKPTSALVIVHTSTPTQTLTYTPTVTETPTSTSTTSTSTPFPTLTALPMIVSGAGSSNPNGELPAVQQPGQGPSPFSSPGPLGMIIAVLIIVVCFAGGFFFVKRRMSLGSTSELGRLPYAERGGNENLTVTVSDSNLDGELRNLPAIQRGDIEGATLTRQDINDISSDVNRSAGE